MIRKKMKKKYTPHEKLRFKKYALYEFLDDINKYLMSEDHIDIIKEVFVKELKPLKNFESDEEENDKNEIKSSKSKSKKNKKKSSNGLKIYYGIFNSDIKIQRYLEIFKDNIEIKNFVDQKKKTDHDTESIFTSQHQSAKFTKSRTFMDRIKFGSTLSEAQTQILIHQTHFKNLIRKILFEKFQKMRIWCRQSYSQNNKRVYLHLKIQGRVNKTIS